MIGPRKVPSKTRVTEGPSPNPLEVGQYIMKKGAFPPNGIEHECIKTMEDEIIFMLRGRRVPIYIATIDGWRSRSRPTFLFHLRQCNMQRMCSTKHIQSTRVAQASLQSSSERYYKVGQKDFVHMRTSAMPQPAFHPRAARNELNLFSRLTC